MLCSASALSLWSKVGSFKGRHQQPSLSSIYIQGVFSLFCLLACISQTYLSCLMNSTSCPWWHFLIQFTQIALRSVVLQVWHLWKPKVCFLTITNKNSWGYFWVREVKKSLPVKIVHWVAGVTWNLVQALTSAHSFFNGILIVQYFIIWRKQKFVRWCFDPLWDFCIFIQ